MGEIITKSNQVIRASYRLTPNEQAIILQAIAQIPKGEQISDHVEYSLCLDALVKRTGKQRGHAYRDFKSACVSLFERKLTISNGENRLTRWCQDVVYSDETKTIKIKFGHTILPYLSNLKENFTSYNLQHVAKFKSSYGVRIYELIKQWSNTRSYIEISIDEMKFMFQLGSSYNQMCNLKNKVINPALRDINDFSDFKVSCENIKTGRKITGLRFKFKQKSCINEASLARIGESEYDLKQRLKQSPKKSDLLDKEVRDYLSYGAKHIADDTCDSSIIIKGMDFLKNNGGNNEEVFQKLRKEYIL